MQTFETVSGIDLGDDRLPPASSGYPPPLMDPQPRMKRTPNTPLRSCDRWSNDFRLHDVSPSTEEEVDGLLQLIADVRGESLEAERTGLAERTDWLVTMMCAILRYYVLMSWTAGLRIPVWLSSCS